MVTKQDTLRQQLAKVPITPTNATAFYVHMFTVAPQLRIFFKGAEQITPAEIPASERFQKQGQRLLMSVHVLVEVWHNPMVLNAYVRDLMDKHRRFKGIEYDHYAAFFDVWHGYLEKMTGKESEDEAAAWAAFKKDFLELVKVHVVLAKPQDN